MNIPVPKNFNDSEMSFVFDKLILPHAKNLNLEISMLPEGNDGQTSFEDIDLSNNDISSIIIQSPNFIGQIEDWSKISNKIKDLSALLIGVSDPTTLSILNPPGHCGVDIYVGEGQTLGNYLSYGGPYLGLMSVKNSLIRKIPGRIVGKTEDIDGKTGYTLTLQTREQHIRRERATSNICTNQGLIALRATLYLSLMGAEGLKKINQVVTHESSPQILGMINVVSHLVNIEK